MSVCCATLLSNELVGYFGWNRDTTEEEVTLQLLYSKCVPVLLYGLEACPLNISDLKSLDFVIEAI